MPGTGIQNPSPLCLPGSLMEPELTQWGSGRRPHPRPHPRAPRGLPSGNYRYAKPAPPPTTRLAWAPVAVTLSSPQVRLHWLRLLCRPGRRHSAKRCCLAGARLAPRPSCDLTRQVRGYSSTQERTRVKTKWKQSLLVIMDCIQIINIITQALQK